MARSKRPFDYHKPEADEIDRISSVRQLYQACLEGVEANTKPGEISGRYVALAITALEESAMWATKSIVFEADNERPENWAPPPSCEKKGP